MTDRKEIEAWIAKARAAGGRVTVRLGVEGYIDGVTVKLLKGVGGQEMGPLHFAECMRRHFAK